MSLRAAARARAERPGTPCRVPAVRARLPKDEQPEFDEMTADRGESMAALARTLVKDRGIDLYANVKQLTDALGRHRRGDCSCR